jgi:hypothetical protein
LIGRSIFLNGSGSGLVEGEEFAAGVAEGEEVAAGVGEALGGVWIGGAGELGRG